MIRKKSTVYKLSLILFSTGLLLGLILLGGSTWADYEATLFDSTLPASWADTELTTLGCPIVISSQETGVVTASFSNTTPKPVNLRIRIHISDGLVTLIREENTILALTPGEIKVGEWTVYPENAAWGNFILVRAFQFSTSQIPSRSSSCGILVIDLFNLSGTQIIFLLITISILTMSGGLGLYIYISSPLQGRSMSIAIVMSLLAILVIIGNVFIFLGSLMVGAGFLLITVLLLVSLLPFAFRSQTL